MYNFTDGSVCSTNLEAETAGPGTSCSLLRRARVEAGQVAHAEVGDGGGCAEPQLAQARAAVAEHAEGVVGGEAAEVEAGELGEAAQRVRDDVAVVLQHVLGGCQVVVAALHRSVVQSWTT